MINNNNNQQQQQGSSSSNTNNNNLKSKKYNDNLTEYQYFLFSEGFEGLFKLWHGIQLAKKHEACGDDTIDLINEFQDKLKEWITIDGDLLQYDEIENYINDVLSEDLGIDILDGSINEFSKNVLNLFKEILNLNLNSLQVILNKVNQLENKKNENVKIPTESEFVENLQKEQLELNSRMNEMMLMEEEEEDKVEVDEDGFQMVTKKSNKRR
ncbi:hypothetical protein ABK040_009057 [Willaertia magna]